MTIKKLAGALLASMLAVSSANAALINIQVTTGATQAAAAEANFLGLANPGYITETFNLWDMSGFTDTGVQQSSWVATSSFFNTAAGTFTVLQGAVADNGEVNPDKLMIESIQTGEFGRDTTKAAGDFWLDSNDVEQMTWDLGSVNASFDSLGFYMVDANDNGAQLILRFSDGTTSNIVIPTGASNGAVAYIRLISNVSIKFATILFDNNGNSTTARTNDGYSIDNVTVASVPEPTALALLGLGLLGFAAARKRL
jgi:hypothetical protein